MSNRVRSIAQLGMDEHVVDNPALEAALSDREDARSVLSGDRKRFKEAHDKAVELIRDLPADDRPMHNDQVIRVGDFRITYREVPARSVSFDTDAKSRFVITAIDE